MKLSSTPVRTLAAIAIFAAATLPGSPAAAKDWPERPVRVVVPGTPGATADLVARVVAEGMSASLGQPFVVEAKPGGSGAIAVIDMLRSPHDGYTVMIGNSAIVSEIPHTVKYSFDPAKDIRPLAQLVRGGLVLVGNPAVPADTLPELLAWIKSQPGGVSYASYSPGTLSHIMGLELARSAGVELTHVGYKGSTPGLQDVMGNQVPLMFDGMITSLPLIKAHKVKAFAVSSPKRSEVLPDVPTFEELGFPNMTAVGWIGLWTTPDVPESVQDKLRETALKVLQQPEVRERFRELGQDVGQTLTVEELESALARDYQHVGSVLQAVGHKAPQ